MFRMHRVISASVVVLFVAGCSTTETKEPDTQSDSTPVSDTQKEVSVPDVAQDSDGQNKPDVEDVTLDTANTEDTQADSGSPDVPVEDTATPSDTGLADTGAADTKDSAGAADVAVDSGGVEDSGPGKDTPNQADVMPKDTAPVSDVASDAPEPPAEPKPCITGISCTEFPEWFCKAPGCGDGLDGTCSPKPVSCDDAKITGACGCDGKPYLSA